MAGIASIPVAREPSRPAPPIPRGVVGMLLFLGTEAMFFAALISAFLILRAGAPAWPPEGQPRLPLVVTGFNTVVLLASGVTMILAARASRRARKTAARAWLVATGLLGAIFLGIQGTEWVRLVSFGLTVRSGQYGATFYTLIGCHAVHVLAAVTTLLGLLFVAAHQERDVGIEEIEVCQAYWLFVVAVWPILFFLVYLS